MAKFKTRNINDLIVILVLFEATITKPMSQSTPSKRSSLKRELEGLHHVADEEVSALDVLHAPVMLRVVGHRDRRLAVDVLECGRGSERREHERGQDLCGVLCGSVRRDV